MQVRQSFVPKPVLRTLDPSDSDTGIDDEILEYVLRFGAAIGLDDIYRAGVFIAETRRDCAIALSRLVRAGRLATVDVDGQRLYLGAPGLPS